VLALPAALLPDLAVHALEAGKHVMVEKPMADSLAAGTRMLEAARASDRAAMVDFTFVYSPPVRALKRLFESGSIGEPHYYQSTRINLGRFQPDIDVVWDLVVHDVAILAYVLGRDPVSVTATGRGRGPRVDTANVTLTYEDGLQAFIHVSWMAPMKVRTSLLACDQGMIVYDDVQSDEKIKVYRVQGKFDPETENALVPTFRLGDVSIPRLEQEEPLRSVAATFLEGCRGTATPLTDWSFGVRVLAVLEAARASLATGQAVAVGGSAVVV
jgi:predicted dehydrogenase